MSVSFNHEITRTGWNIILFFKHTISSITNKKSGQEWVERLLISSSTRAAASLPTRLQTSDVLPSVLISEHL